MRRIGFLILTVIYLGACGTPGQKGDADGSVTSNGAADSADAMGSAGSESPTVSYARGFRLEYHDHYKVLSIVDSITHKIDTLRYLLVQRGYPTPAGYPGAQVIYIPVRQIIAMSSMHIALTGFAGVSDRITGLGSLQYVSDTIVRKNIKLGKIAEVGMDANMNNEKVIAMHPDLVMVMANPDASFGAYKTLTDAKVPILLNTEWLESTPLGRSEWVKVMGALTNRERLVDRKFDSVALAYNQLAQIGRKAAVKPKVIVGTPFKGTWYVPAGSSYMAQFLRDAGATYKWNETQGGGSIPLTFESVAPEALTADYWVNIGYVNAKADILSKDPRYGSFKPFKTGALFNNNGKVNDQGSNDYWESGEVNPQIILADLIRILHPELLPNHTLVYYKQLK